MSPPTPAEASALEAIGLMAGEPVRFRRAGQARWQPGTVVVLERDGSLRVSDRDGAARSVKIAQVQVRAHRAGSWEPVADRAGRGRQLEFALAKRRKGRR